MAQLWQKQTPREWTAVEIDSPFFLPPALDSDSPPAGEAAAGAVGVGSLHASAVGPNAENWLLLIRRDSDATVNGRPVPTGLVALRDRDEIRLASGERIFFSLEKLAIVEPFGSAEASLRCARCRRRVAPASLVVRCPAPGCGVVHHESADYACWSYAESCSICAQPTQLGGDYRWSPEGL